MTETSPFAITHPVTEPFSVTAPLNSPVVNGAVSDSVPPDEEEPYTIKCICAFEDDDGNTVFCEGCETWQHIECYYHARDVPDVHNCVDCEPRHLDGRRATERQKRLREQSDGGDRKAKRSTKSHKKKVKDHGDQVNGFHQRSESSSRDQPPSKKTKINHRTSGSVSSLPGVPALSSDGRKRTAASLSPSKSSGPVIPLYSQEFLHLYDQDQGPTDSGGNIFVNLTLAADLASWVKDPISLAQVANGRAGEVFTRSGAALDKSHWPSLSLESITDPSTEVDGKHPTWKILKTQSGVGKDEIVGEITGKIGLLRDYSFDPSNRWQELRHPEPFVFFHPQLPIYIDTRQEGSVLRYARRSCRPNVTMKTYITNEVEYHFCFVAKEDIPPNTEITTTWYLDAQLFGSSNGLIKQESGDGVPEMAAVCISNVLANFGGCACIRPPNCFLSALDRRRHPKVISDVSAKQAHAKRKKTKTKSTVSPPTNNSRAGSETARNVEDDDHADSRSASSSTRGQTRSRDLTPTLQTSTEVFAFGASELSARERRKIAAAEKKFQQLEQDQQVPHKRKKRVSGQSAQTPGARPYDRQSHSPPLSASGHGPQRKHSGPSTPLTQYSSSHFQYVDSAVQAELDVSNGVLPSPPSKRPNFIPLTQRLLKRCHMDRLRLEHTSRQQPVSPQSTKSVHEVLLPQPRAVATPTATTPSVSGEKEDLEMRDLESPTGSTRSQTRNPSVDISPSHGRGPGKTLPFTSPWPSSAAHIARIPAHKATSPHVDLQVPLPPATAALHYSAVSPNSTVSSAVSSPSTLDQSSHHPTAVMAPSGAGLVAPSPVKKKLSLGDYLSRRGSLKTPTTEKSQAQAAAMLPPTVPTQPPERRDGLVKTSNPQTEVSSSAQLGNPAASDVTMKDVPDSAPTADPPSVS